LFSKRNETMNTHVFVVDSRTFKLHLEFMFAGTGAGTLDVDFNDRRETRLKGKSENLLVSMIADANRIRRGDLILFYLQRNTENKIQEGKFYGIFRAAQDYAFLDDCDPRQYLRYELGKSLTFRTLIEPSEVYSAGITEWEALDEISDIKKPQQMLWSLIYRKLKGKRGNTMITPYESKRLCELIKKKNNKRSIRFQTKLLSFDVLSQEIICLKESGRVYGGRKETINILPRLVERNRRGNQFENHLQAYIARNVGTKLNPGLDNCLLDQKQLEWFGNEVSCGVGMQRIDLLLSLTSGTRRTLGIVELKSQHAKVQTINQMQRYVDWVRQYYTPNCRGTTQIEPVLIARKIKRKSTAKGTSTIHYQHFIESMKRFNDKNRRNCNNLRYVEFDVVGDDMVFESVEY